jgi:K+-sensing histidine kinase KdpD
VFIRFGGPHFTDEQVNLAEFIATHVNQVLEHKRMVERIGNLEAERRLALLQSDFVATVSHELKTPLGFIKGYSTSLLRKEANWDEETRDEFLQIIDEETDRLTELVDNLLDSSRLQSGTLEFSLVPSNLVPLIDTNIARFRSRYPNLDIRWRPTKKEYSASVDSKRFSQVLENLVSNAAKYAPVGPVTIRLSESNGDVLLHVKDRGPGILLAETELIFKRFFRSADVKDKVRGTGLGLYICKQIVDAHHGSIRVKLGKPRGAEFIISLPKQKKGNAIS